MPRLSKNNKWLVFLQAFRSTHPGMKGAVKAASLAYRATTPTAGSKRKALPEVTAPKASTRSKQSESAAAAPMATPAAAPMATPVAASRASASGIRSKDRATDLDLHSFGTGIDLLGVFKEVENAYNGATGKDKRKILNITTEYLTQIRNRHKNVAPAPLTWGNSP